MIILPFDQIVKQRVKDHTFEQRDDFVNMFIDQLYNKRIIFLILVSTMDSNKYQKYKIPPNFQLAELHARSCRVNQNKQYQKSDYPISLCGCCNQVIGTKNVSMCEYVSSLRRIGEQVPVFFNFINLMILLSILITFLKVGQMLFFCDDCQTVTYTEKIWEQQFTFSLGYINHSNLKMMIEVIVYSVVLLMIKINLKIKKYKYRAFNFSIQKRSLQLINLSKDCSEKSIRFLFRKYHIQSIDFTYKVQQYRKCMTKIARLKKSLRILRNKLNNGNDQNVRNLQTKLENTKKLFNIIVKTIHKKKKRLSVAYVVFFTSQQRNRALRQHRYSAIGKILCKMFTCLSKNNINGQHVTVESAPAPDDIRWENLENPYLRTKAIRFSSLLICITMLIFGLVSQVIVFNSRNNLNQGKSLNQIISSFVIFVINFFIINFLQFTTYKIQAHQSNTRIKLSLIRKITFFMFLNVSICPFITLLYNKIVKDKQDQSSSFLETITITILIISIGNLFKPLLTVFSVSRFSKWYKLWKEKSKKNNSKLNQLQANELFEPMQFPIQVYYSLIHASIMMSFFYLGCFQFLIAFQLFSLLLVYFVAKWMLLKVCKQPKGLSLKLSNLAQSLMRFYVPLYWIGRNMTLAVKQSQKQIDWSGFLQKMFYQDGYQITSTALVVFMLLSEGFVALVAQKLISRLSATSSDYFENKDHHRTYRSANLFFRVHQEDLTHQSKILEDNAMYQKEEQYEQQYGNLKEQLI